MARFWKQPAVATAAAGEPAGAAAPRGRADELLQLARTAGAGDGDAAATLIMHVGGAMLAVVRKVMGRHDADVDDVTQDAVIALLRTLPSFRGECSVVHFAHRIALLTALGARRRTRARRRWADPGGVAIEDLADDQVGSPLGSPLAATVARRRRALVRRLLDDLPDVIAEALALHFVVGHTVEEIAAALSVSPNTVWSRLRLGKQALRRKLAGDLELAEILQEILEECGDDRGEAGG